MANFKLDMHVHTQEVSNCGTITAEKVVRLYKKEGYDGIVITDHYYDEFFLAREELSWEEQVESYLLGYRTAYQLGQKIGLEVILGLELRFSGDPPNDFLIYGVTPQFLKEQPHLYELGLEEFRELAVNCGLLIYQAHPYRPELKRANPKFLDGVEVYNGNPRHNSRNQLAYQFAEENNLQMISGSDFHQQEELAKGGIVLPTRVDTSPALVSTLQQEKVEIITPD